MNTKSTMERFLLSAFLCVLLSSCIFQSVPECPDKAELFQGGWRLVSIEINGVKSDSDLSKFRLSLLEGGSYNRVSLDEFSDHGTWLLTNNDRVIQLVPDEQPAEEYIVESFNLRKLTLLVDRDNDKAGPDQIKLFLERFN